MENQYDNYERMLIWLLSDASRAIVGGSRHSELGKPGAKELLDLLESDHSSNLEILRYYFNTLCLCIEHNGDNVMIGWEITGKMFEPFTQRYPNVTKALTTYIYS